MALYMTTESARRVLRGMIRESQANVLPKEVMHRKAKEFMMMSLPPARLQKRMAALFSSAISTNHISRKNFNVYQALVPYFSECELGWNMNMAQFEFFEVGYGLQAMTSTINVTFVGHSFERFIQRAKVVKWTELRRELMVAMRFLPFWAARDEHFSRLKQIMLPTSLGAFVGKVGMAGDRIDVTIMTYYNTDEYNTSRVAKLREPLVRALPRMPTYWNMVQLMRHESASMVMEPLLAEILDAAPWLTEEYEAMPY